MAKRDTARLITRPSPPAGLGELTGDGHFAVSLTPALELGKWAQDMILSADGLLHNPEHAHLIDGDIECLWAASGFEKQGRLVLGQAEQVMFRGVAGRSCARCSKWKNGSAACRRSSSPCLPRSAESAATPTSARSSSTSFITSPRTPTNTARPPSRRKGCRS